MIQPIHSADLSVPMGRLNYVQCVMAYSDWFTKTETQHLDQFEVYKLKVIIKNICKKQLKEKSDNG